MKMLKTLALAMVLSFAASTVEVSATDKKVVVKKEQNGKNRKAGKGYKKAGRGNKRGKSMNAKGRMDAKLRNN